MRKTFLMGVALVALISGAARAADDAKKIAQDLTDKWVAAYNTGDAKAIAALYTKDALFSNAGAKDFMKGQDAIEQNLAAGIKQGWKISVMLQEARIEPNGTLTAAGEYTFTGSGPTEGKKFSGHYGTADIKTGNDYKIFLHVSNVPGAAAATPVTKTQ